MCHYSYPSNHWYSDVTGMTTIAGRECDIKKFGHQPRQPNSRLDRASCKIINIISITAFKTWPLRRKGMEKYVIGCPHLGWLLLRSSLPLSHKLGRKSFAWVKPLRWTPSTAIVSIWFLYMRHTAKTKSYSSAGDIGRMHGSILVWVTIILLEASII